MVIFKKIALVESKYLFNTRCYHCEAPITILTRIRYQKHGLYSCTHCIPDSALRNDIDEASDLDINDLILFRGRKYSILKCDNRILGYDGRLKYDNLFTLRKNLFTLRKSCDTIESEEHKVFEL